jgi:hypothetical protein
MLLKQCLISIDRPLLHNLPQRHTVYGSVCQLPFLGPSALPSYECALQGDGSAGFCLVNVSSNLTNSIDPAAGVYLLVKKT